MSLRTVAIIWLPTTICGMGACSWTASFASWLNSSLQNRTFCAASNFCCQCTSGLVLVGPEPRRFIVALHRSSWSEHIIHTYHYLSGTFACLDCWLFYNAVLTPETKLKLENHEDVGIENVACARCDGSVWDLLRFQVLRDAILGLQFERNVGMVMTVTHTVSVDTNLSDRAPLYMQHPAAHWVQSLAGQNLI